ncbi:MAG: HAD family hydrolase [Treponema sp.]
MKKKGAIFDMDGTLLDSMGMWYDIGTLYLKKRGVQAEEGFSERIVDLNMKESADFIRRNYLPELSAQEIIAGLNEVIADGYAHAVMPKAGAKEFLQSLKARGVTCAIATATERSLFMPALKRLGIVELADAIFTCGELGTAKDEPLIYQEAARSLKLPESETVVFEDLLTPVRTAVNAGFCTAAVYDDFSASSWQEIKRIANIHVYNFTTTLI